MRAKSACYFVLLYTNLFGSIAFLWNSERESIHGGSDFYEQPPIVHEFLISWYGQREESQMNLFSTHLKLVQSFCHVRRPRECTWKDFYHLLDFLRRSYEYDDDIGVEDIDRVSVQEVHHWIDRDSEGDRACSIISEPSASEFFQYVRSNRPFIIRGFASEWPALTKWTLSYLIDVVKDETVVSNIPLITDIINIMLDVCCCKF
jgi:hypothetical protein